MNQSTVVGACRKHTIAPYLVMVLTLVLPCIQNIHVFFIVSIKQLHDISTLAHTHTHSFRKKREDERSRLKTKTKIDGKKLAQLN